MNRPATAVSERTFHGHPIGLTTLFITELWERFSFYGMRAILVLFMVAALDRGGLGLDDKTATAIYGLYMAGVYLTALPGGWIADRLIGQQRAVWYGGIIIACGHFTLAIPDRATFFVGLVLIVVGTGLLKPNTSALVGDLYPARGPRRDAGFSIYYMGINLGALLGPLVCGYLGQKVDWHYGFAAAGIGMVGGLIVYRSTLRFLGNHGTHAAPAHAEADRQRIFLRHSWQALAGACAILVLLVVLGYTGWVRYSPVAISVWASIAILSAGLGFMAWVYLFGELTAREKRRLLALAILFLVQALFWAGDEQSGSGFTLFAQHYTQLSIFGFGFPASWFQSEPALVVVLLAPFFAWLWIWLGRRQLDPTTPFKFALGMIFVGFGFLVMLGAAWIVTQGSKVGPHWLALTYLLTTTGELCLSPVGLSATTKLAPRRFGGRLMGTWFLFTALGEILAGLIAGGFSPKNVDDMPHVFTVIALVSISVGALLACLSPLIHKRLIEHGANDDDASRGATHY